MPTAKKYTVGMPDGSTVSFLATPGMTDKQVFDRAIQEQDITSGKIPTTYGAGFQQGYGKHFAETGERTGNLVSLAGMVTGQPEIVAAGPLIGRATQAIGEKMAGQEVTVPTATELGTDAALGVAAGYGPAWLAKGGQSASKIFGGLPANTAPQAALKWLGENVPVGRIASYLTPEAVNTGLETGANAVEGAASRGVQALRGAANAAVDTAIRLKGGVSADDSKMFFDLLNNGYKAQTAAGIVSKDPTQISTLLTLAIRNGFKP